LAWRDGDYAPKKPVELVSARSSPGRKLCEADGPVGILVQLPLYLAAQTRNGRSISALSADLRFIRLAAQARTEARFFRDFRQWKK
jgi:hypothetical protein